MHHQSSQWQARLLLASSLLAEQQELQLRAPDRPFPDPLSELWIALVKLLRVVFLLLRKVSDTLNGKPEDFDMGQSDRLFLLLGHDIPPSFPQPQLPSLQHPILR